MADAQTTRAYLSSLIGRYRQEQEALLQERQMIAAVTSSIVDMYRATSDTGSSMSSDEHARVGTLRSEIDRLGIEVSVLGSKINALVQMRIDYEHETGFGITNRGDRQTTKVPEPEPEIAQEQPRRRRIIRRGKRHASSAGT